MVLSDREIARELGYGDLEVEPVDLEEQLQPASLDIRLGDTIYNVSKEEESSNAVHSFNPGDFYLGHSKEYIQMPEYMCAQLTGRSTIGRMGLLVHVTAGWIDNSFNGEITYELFNVSNETIEIESGSRIAQLVFFETGPTSNQYNGQYNEQKGITQSKNV